MRVGVTGKRFVKMNIRVRNRNATTRLYFLSISRAIFGAVLILARGERAVPAVKAEGKITQVLLSADLMPQLFASFDLEDHEVKGVWKRRTKGRFLHRYCRYALPGSRPSRPSVARRLCIS